MPKETREKRPGLQRGIPYDTSRIRGATVQTAVAGRPQDESGDKADNLLMTYNLVPFPETSEWSTVNHKPSPRRGIMRKTAVPSLRRVGADTREKGATRKVRFLEGGTARIGDRMDTEGRERTVNKHDKLSSVPPETNQKTDLEGYAADNESSRAAGKGAAMVQLQHRLEALGI
ncbi:hypothetical protein OE88DRAFT_1735781 [Heliocybe sulcata]|uniref:Uncharacterized protein n=1 Tax=Heliocybe sulcata TaxID=5364 RepID=A0A5C3N0T1_9AGAM|nr:hypothetical protein OE88DRAFT_1735781 [Heliocybe sulcata]